MIMLNILCIIVSSYLITKSKDIFGVVLNMLAVILNSFVVFKELL